MSDGPVPVRFLTNEEVDGALAHVIAVAEGRAGPDRANYLAMSDAEFELLPYAVYRRHAPDGEVVWSWRPMLAPSFAEMICEVTVARELASPADRQPGKI